MVPPLGIFSAEPLASYVKPLLDSKVASVAASPKKTIPFAFLSIGLYDILFLSVVLYYKPICII